jgi:hypothetical protein
MNSRENLAVSLEDNSPLLKSAVCPRIGTGQEGGRARRSKIPCRIVPVIDGCPFRKSRKVGSSQAWITMQRKVSGGESIEDKDDYIWTLFSLLIPGPCTGL